VPAILAAQVLEDEEAAVDEKGIAGIAKQASTRLNCASVSWNA
jgi:hypothetical protein